MKSVRLVATMFAAVVGICSTAMAGRPLTVAEKEQLYVLTGHRDDTGAAARQRVKAAELTADRCRRYGIREVVLLYDDEYDFNWVVNERKVRAFFADRGVPILSVRDATAWLDAKIKGVSDGTAIVMGNGIVPEGWLSRPWGESRLVRYLRKGGRVVWAGDVLFCYGQGETGGLVIAGGVFDEKDFRQEGFLGMRIDRATMFGGYTNRIEQTEKARLWGLERSYGLVRPVLDDGVLDPFVRASDGSFADSGQVCLKPENPLSGIVVLSGRVDGDDAALLRDIWRCAWWSGKPVVVPEPSADAVAEANQPELTWCEQDARTVFLRGEQVQVGVRLKGAAPGTATLALEDGAKRRLRTWAGQINGDGPFAHLDLRGLRRDVYSAVLHLSGRVIRRELRVTSPVDKKGLSVSMWTEFPRPTTRMRRLFEEEILAYGLEPMPMDDATTAAPKDWSLWCGVPFVARRMPESSNAWAPQGYDNYYLQPDGSVRPILAEGNSPTSRGYDNPFRRRLQADLFGEMGRYDAQFPAYRGVTFTADDYSQWFGPSWNRFAVEGFKNRYGIDLPRESVLTPGGNVMTWNREGIVSDGDPVVLASRWFAETHADTAKSMSDSLRKATGGRGCAAPIPGGMMIPMNMWSAFYPEIGFGENGWSQAAFYYYNMYWQPFTANLFWTAAARMGDRKRSVWVMPDCYCTDTFESYYVQNLWNLLAGGAQGLGYFDLPERKNASKKALRLAGDIAGRYGGYLNALEPVRAKCVQVLPFENMISVPERWHQSVITWSNLILEGFDVDPVAADEDWETAQAAFLLNVRTLTQSNFEHLQRFRRRAGRVYIDAASARFFPHEGMTVLPDEVARFENSDFDSSRIGGCIDDRSLRPVESQTRGVFARRFADSLGNRVCWFVDTVGGDLWRQFHASTRGGAPGDASLEKQGGYDAPFVAKVIVREKTGPVAWDVFGRKELPFEKGELSVDMRRWGARLVAFLPESPKAFDVSLPRSVLPGVSFDILIETSGKCVVPFSVSAVDPAGNVSKEYRGRMLSGACGCVKMPVAFAVNDLRGNWTFRVLNEFTGETKTGVVRLE